MSTKKKLTEGKTKIIWEIPRSNKVLIESKDDITAGDGERHNILENKGVLSTETTCNCFRLLKTAEIPTHFVDRIDERTFLAHRVEMLPIELVIRRVATGSYLKRHPETKEGERFKVPKIEFFLKDDAMHDPLMVWDESKCQFTLYNAKQPLSSGNSLGVIAAGQLFFADKADLPRKFESCRKIVIQLGEIALKVFLVFEKAWAKQDVVLVDIKIECGYNADGELIVADVIDNDSWRIWPHGDKAQMKDKQVYRDEKDVTPDKIKDIASNYSWVAEATAKFIQ